ncbi:hypothetical protein [Sphingobium olei]|uniref:AbiTii domain-containing protein n=1 Tax=Sphingobium olei TaxID=420955 RepID=A0ABW3NZ63_9SPHN
MTAENSALMAALEPTWANRELANVIRNLMHQGGWGLDTDAHDWRSDHPLLQAIASLSRPTQSSGEAVALRIGWWNDMRQRGVSQDVAIQKIMGALASFPAPLPAEREVDGEASVGVEVRQIETVTGDFMQEPGEPFWRIEINGYCAEFDSELAAKNFADQINALSAPAQPVSADTQAKSIIANLAAVVRVQNGNKHEDINGLLKTADDFLAAQPVSEQGAGEGSPPYRVDTKAVVTIIDDLLPQPAKENLCTQ